MDAELKEGRTPMILITPGKILVMGDIREITALLANFYISFFIQEFGQKEAKSFWEIARELAENRNKEKESNKKSTVSAKNKAK